MRKSKLLLIPIILQLTCIAKPVIADDVVIEVLIVAKANQIWQPQKSMHLTIAHIKNIESTILQQAIAKFNKQQQRLLTRSLAPGFTVQNFNSNGFNKGYHILEPDLATAERLINVNHQLYQYLKKNYNFNFTDITSPKYIYPTGFTPHIEFLESAADQIPPKNTILAFMNCMLSVRILNFDRIYSNQI